MDESPQVPAVEEFAEALKVALEERREGEGDIAAAIEREIAAEADQIRDYLQAVDGFDHAMAIHQAIVKTMDQTSSPRHGWLGRELARADGAQQAARKRVHELENDAEDHLERIKRLRRIQSAVQGN